MAIRHRTRPPARTRPAGQHRSGSEWERSEQTLLQFFQTYAPDAPDRRHLLRLPWRAIQVVHAARSLPVLEADVPDSPQGQIIREGLAHLRRRTPKTGFVHTPLHEVASVLILPRTPREYATGSSRQTVRRKSRAAERAGVRWRTVDDPDERRHLIALSEAREGSHPQARYRTADVDNSYLQNVALWLVAYSKEDVPLLVAAVPVEGEWSILTYFRTLEDSPAASNARYLMSVELVEQLVARGVRYLADTATMSNLPDGLRHFQRMLGYRVVRVRVARASPQPPRGTRAPERDQSSDEALLSVGLPANRV